MVYFSDDTEDATRSQKRMESSSSVESSISPKRFYRKSSNESTPTSGRKRKLQEKGESPVRVKTKLKRKTEPISPDLMSDFEEEKENKNRERSRRRGEDEIPEASEEASNSLKTRRESDEMVAPSPHSTSVMSQRMSKGVQRKTKTAVTPGEETMASSVYQDTPVTRNKKEKKKQVNGNRIEETEGNSSETPTDDSIEEILTPSRRSKRTTPSVFKTKSRKELYEDTESATPLMEEIAVRRSPRSRSGSVDTEKSGSSEASSSLLRKVHAKKLKELQPSSEGADKEDSIEKKMDENLSAKKQVCAKDSNRKNKTDSNEKKNSAIDPPANSTEMLQKQRKDESPGSSARIEPMNESVGIDRDRDSPAPSVRTKRLKEDARESPVRTSPRIRGKEPAKSLESSKTSNEAGKQNEKMDETSSRPDTPAIEGKGSESGDVDMDDQYGKHSSGVDEDLEIVMEIDAEVASDESEDNYMDASEVQEDEDEFVDAPEELPPSDHNMNSSVEPHPEIIEISESSEKSQSQKQPAEETKEVKFPTLRRSKRSNGATPESNKTTTEEQDLEDDSEEAVGPTQEIRRVVGDLTESPHKKPKKSNNDSEKLSKSKNTNLKNKEESPHLARLNNKERSESGEDDETPVLRRTRRVLKDSPLIKEIRSEDGDFASPKGGKKHGDTPKAVVTGKVIATRGTPKESPLFARLRNRRRIESSDEESGTEQTPVTVRSRKGMAQSNQVKAIDSENSNKDPKESGADDETPVLRRTRRVHKDSPLLKEINSTAGDFVSPEPDKKSKVTLKVSTAEVIAKRDTPKESPQITRLRNRKIIESNDDESGAESTPVAAKKKWNRENEMVDKNRETVETGESDDETRVLRRTRRMDNKSPLLKENGLPDLAMSTVTTSGDTPKESPQFVRLRNRRRIESSDEESAAEETPRLTRRRGVLASPLVKEVNDESIGKNETPKGTSGLRATRGSVKKDTPHKGISNLATSGTDKQTRPNKSTIENMEAVRNNGKMTRTTEDDAGKQSVEEDEDDVQVASNELSGSDESLEQFQTPSEKIDGEVTLNYKAMSPIKIDKEITLNVGRDSPRAKIPPSSSQNSTRKVTTPKRSPSKTGSARKEKEVSERSPARHSPRQEGGTGTPRSPPKHKHSELEVLWEHTPKGQYGRWKKPGQILYKVPSPPPVSRVIGAEVVPSVADRIAHASGTPPCVTNVSKRGNVGDHEGPIELFIKSPRILRASKASPSPSKSAKGNAPDVDSPKVTPRSTRKTRQTSGTPGNENVREGRNLGSSAVKTPNNKR